MNQLVTAAPDIRDRIFKVLQKTDCTSTRTLLVDILQSIDAPPCFDWIKVRYKLTCAEFRVLEYVLSGQTPSEIAESTGNSLNTVRVQLHKVYKKTNVQSMAGLIALVLQGPKI